MVTSSCVTDQRQHSHLAGFEETLKHQQDRLHFRIQSFQQFRCRCEITSGAQVFKSQTGLDCSLGPKEPHRAFDGVSQTPAFFGVAGFNHGRQQG